MTVESDDTTTGAPASVTSTTAAADGSYSATVPVSFGSNAITVSATASGGRSTGYAQVTVTNEGGGTSVLDVTDPTGDDNGPGTYQYPTATNADGSPVFVPGSFDLTRFQVLSDGTFAYLRVTLRTLVPTFGVLDGAQLLDVYVHVPGATATSTAAAFASRNYTIAPSGAWSQRVEVQGFAAPVWMDASGASVGTAVRAGRPGRPHDHRRAARGAVRHPGLRLGLHRGADRPGRLQPRSRRARSPPTRARSASGSAPLVITRPSVPSTPTPCRRPWTSSLPRESRRPPSSTPPSAPWSSSPSPSPSVSRRPDPSTTRRRRSERTAYIFEIITVFRGKRAPEWRVS